MVRRSLRSTCGIVAAVLMAGGTAFAQGSQPIRIGGVWDLTGPSSAGNGQVARRAVELRVEQANRAGGINGQPVQLIVEDEKSQPTEAVTAINKLINQDRIDAVVCFTTSGSGQAAMPIIERNGLPWVAGVSSAIFSTPPKRWVFQLTPTNDQFIVRTMQYLQQRKLTRFAMLNDSGAYGVDAEKAAESEMKKFGLTMVAHEKFNQGDTDLTAQLTKIKVSDPQAIIVWTTDARAASAASKGAKQLGIASTLLGSSGHANKTFVSLAGAAGDGYLIALTKTYVYASLPDGDPQKALLKAYIEAFQAKYGADADYLKGDYPYDQISIMLDAIKKAGGADRERVRQALEQMNGWKGVTGSIVWTATKRTGIQAQDLVIGKLTPRGWALEP
jgi:branched-chain amino acid transport system substrate-binding protein